MELTLNPASIDDYRTFLASKSQYGGDGGFEPIWMPDCLFDFQASLDEWAIRKGRGAVFADCGLGKSLIQLVWGQNVVEHTNKPVLVVTPIAVGQQTVKEADKFGMHAEISRDGSIKSKIVVTNYERLHYFKPSDFAGVVCDESSIIKNCDGVTKAAVAEFLRTRKYRLLCTATAAPNDWHELGTSSDVLGYLGFRDMITTFFKQETSKDHRGWGRTKYRFREHAKQAFWRWVCSWARACRKPSDLGFSDERFELPPLKVEETVVKRTKRRAGYLIDLPARDLTEQREERRATIRERCEKVAEMVSHGKPAVVWCHGNDEGDLLERLIPDAIQVSGRDSEDDKESKLRSFSDGNARVIVIKPKIGAWGLNWQHCSHMTTFPSHCYDAETELLTTDGWKTFDRVNIGDEVGTVNPASNFFEWQQVTDTIWSLYSGDLILFSGRSYELMVTPNHRMWSRRNPSRYPSTAGRWEVSTAEELEAVWKRQSRDFQSAAAGWVGTGHDSVDIPSSEHVDYTKPRTRMIGSIQSDVFASLAGWYLSEGCVLTRDGVIDGQIVICQTDLHPENREQIIGTLKATGLPVNHDTKNIRICSKELAHFLANELGLRSENKRIPRWLKDWPVERLRIMWEAIMDGDGMHNDGKLCGLKSISSRLIADCQEIGFKLGIATTDRSKEGDYLNVRLEYTHPAMVHRPERIPYVGMVGCVSVPNGLLVVRRNGHAIVSGNSYEQFYQSVRRCWRFGQTNEVRVDIVTTEGEQAVMRNLQRKSDQADEMFTALVAEMNSSMSMDRGSEFLLDERLPSWL